MGLDMYWEVEKTPEEKALTLLEGGDVHERKELGYFRKFYDLNDYMGDLYPEEHQADYNCVDLVIGWDELKAMREFDLGLFFFERACEELQRICDRIESCLKAGRKVFYHPSW